MVASLLVVMIVLQDVPAVVLVAAKEHVQVLQRVPQPAPIV